MDKLEKMVGELTETFEHFKQENNKRVEALEKGDLAELVKNQAEALETKMAELSDSIAELEKEKNRPAQEDFKSIEEETHFKAFENFLRNPRSQKAQGALHDAQVALDATKAVSVGTAADGGYALPEVIDRAIVNKVLDISPLANLVTTVQVGTTDFKKLVNVRGAASGWVGETGTRSETGTSQLAEVAPTFGTVYAYPKATEESLNDLFFNVTDWVVDEASAAIAQAKGVAYLSGNGTNKPTGIIAGSTAATGDEDSPARAFGTIEHVATGVAAAFPQDRLGSPAGKPVDVLISLIYKLKSAYRANAAFMMNKSTLAVIRKWQDANGNYIWQPSTMAGEPSTLLGYPCYENEDMADIGANALPIIFGDFRQAYLACDLVGTRMTVDEITTVGYTKFYVRQRVGGKLMNDDAIKVVKVAAS